MKLTINETLKACRRAKGLTQEEVAAHLGISYQAISKWERGDGYPDITMLPTLAAYFQITVDELLGTAGLADRKDYDAINQCWAEQHRLAKETSDDALHRENAALMRSALKRWPNDALLLVQLSTTLERLDGTDAEKEANLRESVMLQEQILRGEDSEVRSATLYNICFAYERLGEHEKALEAAEKLPNLYKSRENAMVLLHKGKEKRTHAQSALAPLTYCIELHLSALAETDTAGDWDRKLGQIRKILAE
ncbi:MAG: helix-turn-helix domain-containing protein [Clostridia bacterium]|nr:helix-turn-helix domain-containing protein [Clostridia bacterium]